MNIRSKLILAFLSIALSIGILTNGLFYFSAKKNLTRQILNQLESIASIQHHRIRGIVAQNLERWGLVASRTQLRISLAAFNVDGNYELPFLSMIPTVIGTPITVPLAEYITAKMLSFPTVTIPIKQGSDLNSFDIVMKIRNQVLDEVTVTASKDPYECRKKGGKYDFKTKTCIMPKTAKQKTWWQKNWWWLVGGLALTASAITIIVVKKKK